MQKPFLTISDFVKQVTAEKGSHLPSLFSLPPLPSKEPIHLKIQTDGSIISNEAYRKGDDPKGRYLGGGVSFVLYDENGKFCTQQGKSVQTYRITENNEVQTYNPHAMEFEALYYAICYLEEHFSCEQVSLEVETDSQAILLQIIGTNHVSNPIQVALKHAILQKLYRFLSFNVTYIPREYNDKANALARYYARKGKEEN